jgi:hypothetical protein
MKVEAFWDLDTNYVYATITEQTPTKVELWCTTKQDSVSHPSHCESNLTCLSYGTGHKNDPPDLRYSEWTKVNMVKINGELWRATPPEGETQGHRDYQACVVRATNSDCTATSYVLLSEDLCTFSYLDFYEE